MDRDPLWYQDAIIYQLHVKAFLDSNNDGIGDFTGLTACLDYLQDLGVTAVWLLPFYPSPLRDDGYDIADYRNVNPAYGSLEAFQTFVTEAHTRGMRVITELVINHTSDQHPWFQAARQAPPGSPERDFYVWSDDDTRYAGTRIIFCDTEPSNWTWDSVAQQYYWHRFFNHQPDLNFDNPAVTREVQDVMRLWLDMGVDGMRLDAIPYLCEREGTNNENLPETHGVIKELRGWLDQHYGDRMFLGEANQWPEDVRPYFGEGDECHMAFHFPLMPRMYMALAQEDRHPITDIMRQTPDIPDSCQWAIFLRNHDELTLEMVTDRERDYLWRYYAGDPRARINMGIRRRLAPLLNNDRRKIELLNSLLMSMPGTPIIYYGDELGMGDNIYLGDRDGVRTPMQWSPDRNGGFSKADPERLYLPPIMDAVYGFQSVNVEAQTRSPDSLLNWMKRLIAVRKSSVAFGRGSIRFLTPGNRKILAYLREYEDETILCVANLSRAPQPVELDLAEYAGRVPVEMSGRTPFPPVGHLPYFVTLPGYGFYWFQIQDAAAAPEWHEDLSAPLAEFETLVVRGGWFAVTRGGPEYSRLFGRIMYAYLPGKRWWASKGTSLSHLELGDSAVLAPTGFGHLITLIDTHMADDSRHTYFLPLSVTWETGHDDPMAGLHSFALGRVRQVNRVGVLHDAMAVPDFAVAVCQAIQQDQEIPTHGGHRIRFIPTRAMAGRSVPDASQGRRLGAEQSNTSIMLGDEMILKIYRRVEAGAHPEIALGRYLTDEAHFANTPPLLGTVELLDGEDLTPTALAVLHGYVRNQGDAWGYTLDHLSRCLDDLDMTGEMPQEDADSLARYHHFAETLGQRVGEMHRALARATDDPDFRPEPMTADHAATLRQGVLAQAEKAHRLLARVHRENEALDPAVQEAARRLLAEWDRIPALVADSLPDALPVVMTRVHGDLHLGQVMVAADDVVILDFEGEPARSLADRVAKGLAVKDVAGLLRSFNYAVWAALFDRAALRPQVLNEEDHWVHTWEQAAATAFLDAYILTVGDCGVLPAERAAIDRLVTLFTLEKALYELCYEADNRPDWLRIPLQGLCRLLAV